MRRLLLAVLTCACCAGMCAQQSLQESHKTPTDTIVLRNNERRILHTVTISPMYLLKPVVRASYEYRLSADEGLEFSGLGGKMDGWPAWGYAIHYVYYLVGDFEHGMPIGFEIWYTHVGDLTDQTGHRDRGFGSGYILGYKYTAQSGLTASLMGWAGLVGTGGGGPDAQPEASVRGALALNLAIGWSF